MSAATEPHLSLPLRLARQAIHRLARLPRPVLERLARHAPVNSDGERLAPDLSGAAPAYVAVGGFAVLRDEGIDYAERLQQAGVPTVLARHGDLIHAFVNITAVSPSARQASFQVAQAIAASIR